MLPNCQLHLLKKIETRRRYRNWATALQLAMVIFFGDQILKTWCRSHLAIDEGRRLYSESRLEITRVPRRGFFQERVASFKSPWANGIANAVPGVVFILLLMALWLRLREAALGELCAFAAALGGSAANLVSLLFWGSITATLRIALAQQHFIVFNLADLALLVGGAILLRSLTSRLLADLRWVFRRQTG